MLYNFVPNQAGLKFTIALVSQQENTCLNDFHYVYILASDADETRRYTGLTENLESRLKARDLWKMFNFVQVQGQFRRTAELDGF